MSFLPRKSHNAKNRKLFVILLKISLNLQKQYHYITQKCLYDAKGTKTIQLKKKEGYTPLPPQKKTRVQIEKRVMCTKLNMQCIRFMYHMQLSALKIINV